MTEQHSTHYREFFRFPSRDVWREAPEGTDAVGVASSNASASSRPRRSAAREPAR